MDQSQQTQPTQTETPPQQQPVNNIPSSGNKSKLILLIIILLVIVVLGIYYFGAKQNKLNQQTKIIPTTIQASPTPTVVNLNPNTGNLYNDIKTRLNEVIK